MQVPTDATKPRLMGQAVKAAVKILAGADREKLTPEAAADAMKELMSGEATSAQTAAFLALLREDLWTPSLITAFAAVMRANATPVEIPRGEDLVVDIVGTGGDGQDTFNISTAAALVAAGAGARVVKHGNRAASSKSGSADILEALGARLELDPAEVPAVLAASGFTFLFARTYHPAMRFVGPVRQELGIKTIFNILGPITNPARPDSILLGTAFGNLARETAETCKMLGMKRALVVHGYEGLDEISPEGLTMVFELKADGEIVKYDVSPADFGVEKHSLSEVAGGTPAENALEMRDLLVGGGRAAVRDMVLMNAGAALYICGKAATFREGVSTCRAALTDGRAVGAIDAYIAASQKVTLTGAVPLP